MTKILKETDKQQQNLWEIKESFIPEDQRIYIPSWDNQPKAPECVISFLGHKLLTTGNLSTIVSKAGVGKSSVCEAIISALINPECDSLGFDVQLNGYRKKILHIDGERTIHDTWNSWNRVMQRAKLVNPQIFSRLIMANFKAIGILDRIRHVTELINKNDDIGLILFDGGADFVSDTNSITEAANFINWINTFNPILSVLATLHTNPDSNKPRGHIGGELWRRSESVTLLRKVDAQTKEITTNFDYGKVRNDSDNLSNYYQWNDECKMFLSTKYEEQSRNAIDRALQYQDITNSIFDGERQCSFSHIIQKIQKIQGKTPGSAKQFFYRNIQNVTIKKDGDYWIKL